MKKIIRSLAYLAFGVVALSSCKDEEEEKVKPVVVDSKTAVVVGAQSASAGSYYSSSDNKVWMSADVKADSTTNKIDLSFAQTGSTAPGTAKFISMNQRGAEGLTKYTKNTTACFYKLSSVTKEQFDTLQYTNTPITSINLASSGSGSIAIAQDKVYEFHNTTTGAKGLILVKSLVNGTNFDGQATIQVKTAK